MVTAGVRARVERARTAAVHGVLPAATDGTRWVYERLQACQALNGPHTLCTVSGCTGFDTRVYERLQACFEWPAHPLHFERAYGLRHPGVRAPSGVPGFVWPAHFLHRERVYKLCTARAQALHHCDTGTHSLIALNGSYAGTLHLC
jgi:hypothetical protein